MNINSEDKHRLLTLTAFTIGLAFTDNLSFTEQNAIGNFFMLIGQTLCTNGSFKFNKEYKNRYFNQGISDEELLKKMQNIFNSTLNKM